MTKTWKKQNPSGTFVAWGKDKAKDENSFVVEAGNTLQGIIKDIKPSDTYGTIYTLAIKESESDIIVLGTTILNKNMGYVRDKDKKVLPQEMQSGGYTVQVGDEIRIIFNGTKQTARGKDAYLLDVEVNR